MAIPDSRRGWDFIAEQSEEPGCFIVDPVGAYCDGFSRLTEFSERPTAVAYTVKTAREWSGWKVFALQPARKITLVRTRGHLEATSDPARVPEIWTRNPDANIGVSLEASRLVALDVDSCKPDCECATAFAGIEIPSTLEQSSANGCRYCIVKAAPGNSFPGSFCKGVDINHNGYVVLQLSPYNGGHNCFKTDDAPAPASTGCAASRSSKRCREISCSISL